MASLMDKIGILIKKEKTSPERKKSEPVKSSNEILSELFGAFNAAPPTIEEISQKKSKKDKKSKKHKKEKKKRSRSSSSDDSDDSDHSHKRKKRKKSKSKKHSWDSRSPSNHNTKSPKIKLDPTLLVNHKPDKKSETSNVYTVKAERIKSEPKEEPKHRVSIKTEDNTPDIDTSLIPMPDSPRDLDSSDLRLKLDKKVDDDKNKGKIQIKNLKFSTVFEETVKQAEEQARKKAEKYEEGEYTDSSNESVKEVVINSQFPKSADPGGILKKAAEDTKVSEEKSHKKSSSSKRESSSHKSSRKEKERTPKRSSSRPRRSRSRSTSRRRGRQRSASRPPHRASSRTRRRSNSRLRSRVYPPRHHSPPPRYRGGARRPSRSPSGVKLADSEKKRLLEVARRNAINMLKNGEVPGGAAALPPHTRNQVMAAIQSGGKSVDELTDFCKHLSKKEALGELSSVCSEDEDMSENEDTMAFHHPFLVKEKAPIIMNIRGGAPLPVKSTAVVANKDELRLQFPVSSGCQHREKASEWVPVEPKKDLPVAKISSKSAPQPVPAPKAVEPVTPALEPPPPPPAVPEITPLPPPLALPPPPPPPEPVVEPPYMKGFSSGSHLSTVSAVPPLPAPGPQAYPPGVIQPKIDIATIVSQKLLMIRREQEQKDIPLKGFGWSKDRHLGQFTGSTGAQILTPRELASGTQAWAKKDQLQRAAPVAGGMGMHLLQKMGWTPGRGLGKEGTGTLQPLLLEVKLDTKGLQSKEEGPQRYNNKGGKGIRGRGGGGGAPRAPAAPVVAGGKHPVSLLGEYCSKQKVGPPEYTLCFECGPDHKKNFLFKVKVGGTDYQPAVASQNKKQAKLDAAQLALQKLGIITE